MSLVRRPASMEEYLELVKSALFDVEELRMSVEFDSEFMEGALGFVDPLAKSVDVSRTHARGREGPVNPQNSMGSTRWSAKILSRCSIRTGS